VVSRSDNPLLSLRRVLREGRRRPPVLTPVDVLPALEEAPVERPVLPSVDAWDEHLVDSAVYVGGCRVESAGSIDETFARLESHPDGFSWTGLYRPADEALIRMGVEFGIHELAVEDAIESHQRPKLERYGDTLFVALRAAKYRDETEEVEFGELHVFLGPRFIVTVRHSEAPDLSKVRGRLEDDPEMLARGPEAALYAVLDSVVDAYQPVLAGLEKDIDEIEVQVFAGDPSASRRIYELSQEVADFQRAVQPLRRVFEGLTIGFEKYGIDDELRQYLRDVSDHVEQVVDEIGAFRAQLRDILTVSATLVAQRQNDEMRRLSETSNAQNEEVKKISAWAAILFAPTLVGTVYGMNFDAMPELHWTFGYPLALSLMALVSLTLYAVFKKRDWI
jgi:magnesium transporter